MRFTAILAIYAVVTPSLLVAGAAPTGKLEQTKLALAATHTKADPVKAPTAKPPSEKPAPAEAEALEGAEAMASYMRVSRLNAILSCLSYVAVTGLCALVYKMYRRWPAVEQGMQDKDLSKWSSGPFDCFSDFGGFAFAFCCINIRMAESISMLGVTSFWIVLGGFALAALASPYVPAFGMAVIVAGVLWRQTFRKRFNMDGQGECGTVMGDGCMYVCCLPCAVAQEARHLEEAAKANHAAVRDQRPADPEAVPV